MLTTGWQDVLASSQQTHPDADVSLESQRFQQESDVDLSKAQVGRYARQIVLDSFGPAAQERLCRGSVLIIGAGGLGCPCALYLAAAGVGRIGLVDRDTVSLDNLHRQIAHSEARVGTSKVESAASACAAVNSTVEVVRHCCALAPGNAKDLCARYDVVIDCSDNAPTRYVVNDAAVAAGRPLVSGAAVGMDGQLTVYNHAGGPCYRCIFPECPAAATCSSCSDTGVLGPVPGVIGTLQALEAIKLLAGVGDVLAQKLLLFDALSTRFTTVKLRARVADCAACSPDGALRACGGPAGYDYDAFTSGQALAELPSAACTTLAADRRLQPAALRHEWGCCALDSVPAVLLDVRPAVQFATARLHGAVNIPANKVVQRLPEVLGLVGGDRAAPVFVMCRRGNDSQQVVQLLLDEGFSNVRDLVGGYTAYAGSVDSDFPVV